MSNISFVETPSATSQKTEATFIASYLQ